MPNVRILIWDGFRPLIEYLETQDRSPGVAPISATLEAFDPEHVHAAWQKALDRRAADPEGAITAARTFLETVCKYVLDDAGAPNTRTTPIYRSCGHSLPNSSTWRHTSTRKGYSRRFWETASPW